MLPRSLSRHVGDFQRLLKGKVQPCFRRDLHLLPFGENLHARARSTAYCCADRRSLSSAGYRANQRPESRSAANSFSRLFASGRSRLLHVAAHYVVSLALDRKSTRLNSSHSQISYAVFCLKK